jgi:Type II secretion system (T2SS), protein G
MTSRPARALAAVALAAAAAAAGCKGGSPAPTCEEVAAAASRRIGGDPARGVAMCKQQHWSAEVRRCVARAATPRDVMACAGNAAPPPRDPRRQLAAGRDAVIQARLHRLAREAFPMWQAHHPDQACPGSLADLADLVDGRAMRDPWGHDLVMVCGAGAPPAAHGFGVISLGPDGRPGTADDVTSW